MRTVVSIFDVILNRMSLGLTDFQCRTSPSQVATKYHRISLGIIISQGKRACLAGFNLHTQRFWRTRRTNTMLAVRPLDIILFYLTTARLGRSTVSPIAALLIRLIPMNPFSALLRATPFMQAYHHGLRSLVAMPWTVHRLLPRRLPRTILPRRRRWAEQWVHRGSNHRYMLCHKTIC